MDAEARWMINNNLTAETQVPDFPDYIDTHGLQEVMSAAVHMIR